MKLVLKSSLTFLFILSLLNGFLLSQNATPTPQDSSKSVVVNINTAGQAELEQLPGIGPSLAKKILEFRQKNGAFKSPADLTAVQGIGDKKFEQIKNMVTVK
jgi:competence protein ComEA